MGAVQISDDRKPLVRERIRSRVKIEDRGYSSPCWIWQGPLNSQGYAYSSAGTNYAVRVHRAAYFAFVGPIPDGLHLDHLCKVRCCVNPDHLEPVTHLENSRRRDEGKFPPRAARQRTLLGIASGDKSHCRNGHKYTPESTESYLDRRYGTFRRCRICYDARTQRRAERKLAAARRIFDRWTGGEAANGRLPSGTLVLAHSSRTPEQGCH